MEQLSERLQTPISTAELRRCSSAVEIGVCRRSESCSIVVPLHFPLVPAKARTQLDFCFRWNEGDNSNARRH